MSDAKLEKAKGGLKEFAGKLTGDKKTETEGAVEKTLAKAKETVEDAKAAVEGALEGFKKSSKDN